MLRKVTHCAGHVSANTRPHQLRWGDQEMGTACMHFTHYYHPATILFPPPTQNPAWILMKNYNSVPPLKNLILLLLPCLCGEEKKEPCTHCLHMCKVPMVTCKLLHYTKIIVLLLLPSISPSLPPSIQYSYSLCRVGADAQYMQYLSKSRITSPQTRKKLI